MFVKYVFCDMDGVLVDFLSGAGEFFGLTFPKDQDAFDEVWPSNDGWPRLMQERPTFWQDLKPISFALDLWKLIESYNPSLLSAIPPGWPDAARGKELWAKQYLPKFGYHPDQRVMAVNRSAKCNYAKQSDGTPNILIDDFKKNIDEWRDAGGTAILYEPGLLGLNDVRYMLKICAQ